MTILYSSHLMEEAEKLCTRFGIIDEGKLIAEGTREELLQQNTNYKDIERIISAFNRKKHARLIA